MRHSKKAIQLQRRLDNCGKMPLFEIPVICKKTGEKDFVLCDISFRGRSCVARRDPVSSREGRGNKIAESRVLIDPYFDLDAHLEALMNEVLGDILSGDLYELAE